MFDIFEFIGHEPVFCKHEYSIFYVKDKHYKWASKCKNAILQKAAPTILINFGNLLIPFL
jgi:hypothetical protein